MCLPFLQVRKQALDLLLARGVQHGLARVAAGTARRLDVQVVAFPRLDADDLAAASHAETLLRALVTLHLWHLAYAPAGFPAPDTATFDRVRAAGFFFGSSATSASGSAVAAASAGASASDGASAST